MENLRQLMAAYFHQDWSDEYNESWEAAVDDFARREPRRVGETCVEIAATLRIHPREADLAAFLESLGSYYWPGDTPDAHGEWLRGVLDRLFASATD